MSGVTYFYESCPVCGRHLRIPVKHYGRLMECSHCGGEFLAGHPAGEEPPPAERPHVEAMECSVIPRARFGSPHCGEV
jgi:rRNA maturation protein Nop10